MSKTDKTQPYWVQISYDIEDRIEVHHHEHGVCDIDAYSPKDNSYISYWQRHCYYRFRKLNEYWIFNGRPHVQHYRPAHVRAERATWRNKAADLKRMSLEDIYDDEFGNYQHRHSALWEAW